MLAIERRNQILMILQKESRVVVADLAKLFKVTEGNNTQGSGEAGK